MDFGTKEIIEEYCQDQKKDVKSIIDRREMYEYEKKLGKSIFDMNSEELFNMFSSFFQREISYRTYDQIVSRYRQLFNWYIKNKRIIVNPLNNKEITGLNASKKFNPKICLTKDGLENIINKLYNVFSYNRAIYYESIIRLFYEGIYQAREIVLLSPNMVDHRRHVIYLPGREMKLSNRLYSILEEIQKINEIEGGRSSFLLERWHGLYFKYIIRPSKKDEFQNRTEEEITLFIQKALVKAKKAIDADFINGKYLYWMGFYNFLLLKIGKVETDKIILDDRYRLDILMGIANEYGIRHITSTDIKRNIMRFITT